MQIWSLVRIPGLKAHFWFACTQEDAYLCNMAVAPGFRRRNIGSLILDAAEEVVHLAGYRSVYLHLR